MVSIQRFIEAFSYGSILLCILACGNPEPLDESIDTASDTGAANNGDIIIDAGDLSKSICKDVGTGGREMRTRYDVATIPVAGTEKTYILHTNWWFEFDGQTVMYDGLSFTIGNPNNVDVGPAVGAPAGYPSIFIGSYSGHRSKESNLPIKVSNIDSVPTVFNTNGTKGGLENKNAAYDVWFTATGDILPSGQYNPGAGGAFLMVWMFDPPDRQPRGQNAHPGHPVEGIEGSWDVWVHNTDPVCISYVSTTPLDDMEFDLNHFIRDAVENEYGITDEMYLSVIFAGFEIWGGANGLKLQRFCAEVE